MARTLRPRDPIAPMPTHVSQLTCAAIVGIDPRRYLDLLIAHPDVPRASVGRLRIVAVEDLRELLSRIARTGESDEQPEPEDDDAAMTPDQILAAVGMRRSA